MEENSFLFVLSSKTECYFWKNDQTLFEKKDVPKNSNKEKDILLSFKSLNANINLKNLDVRSIDLVFFR